MKHLALLLTLLPCLTFGQSMAAHHGAAGAVGQYASEAPPTAAANLVGWWRFNGTDTGASVKDWSTAAANVMTQATAAAQCTVNGGYGTFDGGDYLNSPTKTLLNNATELTVCGWFRVPDTSDSRIYQSGIVVYRGSRAFGLQILDDGSGGASRVAVVVAASMYPCSGASITNNTWYFLAATHKKNALPGGPEVRATFAGDCGYETASAATTTFTVNDNWRIGWNDGNGTGYYFVGDIDDVRLYNAQLTETQLRAIYAEGRR